MYEMSPQLRNRLPVFFACDVLSESHLVEFAGKPLRKLCHGDAWSIRTSFDE